MAGYSGTPLVKKLGFRPGMRVRFIGAPNDYAQLLGSLPDDVTIAPRTQGRFDLVHLFAPDVATLERHLPTLHRAIKPDGMAWISWPKKASGVETDITEAIVREAGLETGLVDVKICAVDATWSGLKFVVRRRDR